MKQKKKTRMKRGAGVRRNRRAPTWRRRYPAKRPAKATKKVRDGGQGQCGLEVWGGKRQNTVHRI